MWASINLMTQVSGSLRRRTEKGMFIAKKACIDREVLWKQTDKVETLCRYNRAKYKIFSCISLYIKRKYYLIKDKIPGLLLEYFCLNLLNPKLRLLYLKTQFVPRSKHFSSPL